MSDRADENLDRLFRAARAFAPDTAMGENHFETRLMTRIRERQSARTSWVSWAWRLAPGFAALAILLGVLSLVIEPGPSQDMVAAIISGNENQLIARYLIGG